MPKRFFVGSNFLVNTKNFQNFKEKIDELQLYRNTVMHHKRITQQKYAEVRKSLKAVNKLLVDAINVLEEHLYTETLPGRCCFCIRKSNI